MAAEPEPEGTAAVGLFFDFDNLERRVKYFVSNMDAFGKGCWEWSGCTNGRYGKVHLTIGGDSMWVSAHRASYMAFNKKIDLNHDISHLCHEKLCVNPAHLSHEPRHVNKRRNTCRRQGKPCTGHGTYKNCIL